MLQRIAICYAIAAAIYLTTSLRGQIVWIGALLTAYWLLMTLVPVPGYGAGRLDVEGNLAHYVDRIVLGAHNYRHTQDVGSGGDRQHAAGDRDGAVRGDGGAHPAGADAIWRSGRRGCSSRGTC